MAFKEASRKSVRMKMCLSGKAGSGKTLGSLMIAKGMVQDMSKVAYIQTEPGRAECYLSDFGGFHIENMKPPYTPERFTELIGEAQEAGYKVLIIDSLSDEWDGTGGVLEELEKLKALNPKSNSFTMWRKLTPRHNAMFHAILSSPIHIISTVRKKTETVMEKNEKGKMVPKKVGLKDVQRDDGEYKWMLQLDLDQENMASVVKDNTSLFQGKTFKITPEVGSAIRDWCLN